MRTDTTDSQPATWREAIRANMLPALVALLVAATAILVSIQGYNVAHNKPWPE